MATPMLDSELNELVHIVSDELDKYTDTPVNRYAVNTHLTHIFEIYFEIQIEGD